MWRLVYVWHFWHGRCVGRVVGGCRVTGVLICGWLVVLIGMGPNGTLRGNRVAGSDQLWDLKGNG